MSAISLDEFRETRESEETLFTTVGRRKGVFAVTLGLVAFGGLFATYNAAPVYEATSTLVFPLKTASVLSPTQATIGGALGSLGAATPLRQSQFLLESPAATARVAPNLGMTRTEAEKHRRIENNPTANALVVRATSERPEEAQRICRLYVDALRNLSDTTGDAGEKGDMRVLERRIVETDKEARTARTELARFQKGLVSSPGLVPSNGGVLVVPGPWQEERRRAELELGQIDARIAARRKNTFTAARIATTDPTNLPTVRPLRDRLVALDLDLRTAESVGGPQSPDVVRLKGEIAATRITLRKELDGYMRAYRANVSDTDTLSLLTERVSTDARLRSAARLAQAAPAEAARYQTLLERVQDATETLERLRGQRTAAELQSQSDPNRWAVLDDATLAEKPVNKSYIQAGLIYLPLGLVLASAMACVVDRRRR